MRHHKKMAVNKKCEEEVMGVIAKAKGRTSQVGGQ